MFVAAVDPVWVVIRCGEGNGSGHPHERVLHFLKGVEILRTGRLGIIVFHSDGKTLTVTTSIAPEAEVRYYGNRKAMVFHRPGCDIVADMAESNKVPLDCSLV